MHFLDLTRSSELTQHIAEYASSTFYTAVILSLDHDTWLVHIEEIQRYQQFAWEYSEYLEALIDRQLGDVELRIARFFHDSSSSSDDEPYDRSVRHWEEIEWDERLAAQAFMSAPSDYIGTDETGVPQWAGPW